METDPVDLAQIRIEELSFDEGAEGEHAARELGEGDGDDSTRRVLVDWDTTTDEHPGGDPAAALPDAVEVPAELIHEFESGAADDPVADWLSETFGWCVNGWGDDQ